MGCACKTAVLLRSGRRQNLITYLSSVLPLPLKAEIGEAEISAISRVHPSRTVGAFNSSSLQHTIFRAK